jgi:hypothetical protein
MALIQKGTVSDFSVNARRESIIGSTLFSVVKKLHEFEQLQRTLPENSFEYTTSPEARGIALKSIKLTKGFEGILGNLFNLTNEVYFLAWAFDLSGQPLHFYPGQDIEPDSFIIPMKVGNVREFLGSGINLFPKRKVVGGIVLRIQIWESDKKVRSFGKVLKETADAIKKSELTHLLSAASLITGVSGATISLVTKASLELAGVIGTILKANSDDYVDFYEGYYPADTKWQTTEEKNSGLHSNIVLNMY